MVSAALGGRQGWSKLDRLGTVAPLPPRPSSMLPAPMPAMVTEA
jgi:hypothetical protein